MDLLLTYRLARRARDTYPPGREYSFGTALLPLLPSPHLNANVESRVDARRDREVCDGKAAKYSSTWTTGSLWQRIFRSVLQKCALWNDGKNETSLSLFLRRTISNLLFVLLPPSFCPPYFCSRHFSTFRIGSSGSGFPDVERSAPCRFFVRINCNTLRIGLIDRSRERERGEISRTKKGREERRGEIARGKRYRVVFIA